MVGKLFKGCLMIVGGLAVLGVIAALIGGGSDNEASAPGARPTSAQTEGAAAQPAAVEPTAAPQPRAVGPLGCSRE